MSRNVYSIRLFAAGSLVPADGLVGPVVPDGFVWVLRDIDAVLSAGRGPAELFVWGQALQLLTLLEIQDGQLLNTAQWRGRQVYNVGERIGFQSATGTWDIAASGYQLTLP